MKPYYEHAGITIYHGDCREILPTLAADVCVTDPPYGVSGGSGGDSRDFGKARYAGDWQDTEEYLRDHCLPALFKFIKKAKRSAVTSGIRCLHLYPKFIDMGCFWTPAAATHGPWGFCTFNPILYYGKDYRAGLGAWPSGIQVTEQAEKNGHPCPKPIAAWKWLVAKTSEEADVIVDPFCGSGTTLLAAKDLGRRAIGIEIVEEYCELSAKRLSQEVFNFG